MSETSMSSAESSGIEKLSEVNLSGTDKRKSENREVWAVLKLLESILSGACMIIHTIGFSYQLEPFQHELIFCGTYFAFFLIPIFSFIGIKLKNRIPIFMDAVICCTAAFFFILSAFISMYHAEHDFHLMYLTDEEEAKHFFFMMSRLQSIFALITGYLFLLNGLFAIDLLWYREPRNIQRPIPKSRSQMSLSDLDHEAVEPLQLSMFWIPLFHWTVNSIQAGFKKLFCRRGSRPMDENVAENAATS